MVATLHVESVRPAAPAAAACAVTDAVVADAPRRRGTLIAWLAHDDAPGRAPAPWTADGIADSLGDDLAATALGPGPIDRRFASADDGPVLALSLPGATTPLRVRAGWLGRRLLLVAPGGDPSGEDRGPATAAFAGFATALAGGTRLHDAADLGQRWAAALFCHVAVLLDASWWTRGRTLHATERCLGFVAHGTAPTDAAQVDRWLAARLGRHEYEPAGLTVRGGAARRPWPNLATPAPVAADWAHTRVDALWPRPPAVPARPVGQLARAWAEYRTRTGSPR